MTFIPNFNEISPNSHNFLSIGVNIFELYLLTFGIKLRKYFPNFKSLIQFSQNIFQDDWNAVLSFFYRTSLILLLLLKQKQQQRQSVNGQLQVNK